MSSGEYTLEFWVPTHFVLTLSSSNSTNSLSISLAYAYLLIYFDNIILVKFVYYLSWMSLVLIFYIFRQFMIVF